MDREKVIKGLEHCIASSDCRGCPYFKQIEEDGNLCALRADALALLKEQKAVKPNRSGGMRPGWWCGACNYEIGQGDKYCKHCGQAVKWK